MAPYDVMARRRASTVGDPQVVRALALLMEMARSKRGILLKPFAEKRGYPLRAVYRSRDVLVKAGAPIRQNPDSPARWQLMDGWLPPAVVGADATVGEVGGRLHLSWRLRVRPAPFGIGDDWHVIEQQAYADAAETIDSLDLLCSGFRPDRVTERR